MQGPRLLALITAIALTLGLCVCSGVLLVIVGVQQQSTASPSGLAPSTPPTPSTPSAPWVPPPTAPSQGVAGPGAPSVPTVPASSVRTTPATATLALTTDTPTRGPANAPVTIHVVSDFQCPFCARAERTIQQLDADNPGRLRWVWHDYPLPFHQRATPAAMAARAVRAQLGDPGFWSYHDALFANQRALEDADLDRMASLLPGIDLARFQRDRSADRFRILIEHDTADVNAAGGSGGTPRFLIGDRWLVGAQPASSFQALIEELDPR